MAEEQDTPLPERIKRKRNDRKSRAEINADQRRRMQEHKDKGLCVSCNRPAVSGKVLCEFHAEKNSRDQKRRRRGMPREKQDVLNAAARRRMEEHKAKGLCIYCTRPTNGKVVCDWHADKAKRAAARKQERGSCPCGKPARYGKRLCAKCQQRSNESIRALQQRRQEQGLCMYCGKSPATEGKRGCNECRLRLADRAITTRELRLARGDCVNCGRQPHLPTRTCCKVCLLRRHSHSHFGTVKLAGQLLEIFERQGGRCVYTGRLLTMGVDAELDHIVALSRGGVNDLSNVQWVHTSVNQMKWSFAEEEFLGMVEEIHRHRLNLL